MNHSACASSRIQRHRKSPSFRGHCITMDSIETQRACHCPAPRFRLVLASDEYGESSKHCIICTLTVKHMLSNYDVLSTVPACLSAVGDSLQFLRTMQACSTASTAHAVAVSRAMTEHPEPADAHKGFNCLPPFLPCIPAQTSYKSNKYLMQGGGLHIKGS